MIRLAKLAMRYVCTELLLPTMRGRGPSVLCPTQQRATVAQGKRTTHRFMPPPFRTTPKLLLSKRGRGRFVSPRGVV